MINENILEVTRTIGPRVYYWKPEQEETEYLLIQLRSVLWLNLEARERLTLNEALRYLDLQESREGLTLGWDHLDAKKPTGEEMFTWTFCADSTIEVTFHNLSDISDLYKTEEELA